MTVRELLARADSAELTEWMAFYSIDPFGGERADYRAGLICSTLANVHRGRNGRTYRPHDFMPFADKRGQQKALTEKIKAFFSRKK